MNEKPPKPPIPIPASYDEKRVRAEFWPKVKAIAAKVPGVVDLIALYFYMNSDKAPIQHKLSVIATLAYFIMPFDLIPDFLGPIGYVDDLALAAGLIKFIGADVMQPYRAYARKWLAGQLPAQQPRRASAPPKPPPSPAPSSKMIDVVVSRPVVRGEAAGK